MSTDSPPADDSEVGSTPEGLVVTDPDDLRRLVRSILPDRETPRLSAVLREIAAERDRERDRMREVPDDSTAYVSEIPPTDDQSHIEVLLDVLQGTWAIHQWVRFHDYALYHDRLGDHAADVWHIYHAESGEYIDTVNVAAFRSATALESWLLDLQAAQPTAVSEWRQVGEGTDD